MTASNDEYVDSKQGIAILGDRSAFFYHAEKGDISLAPGSTRRHQRYKLADILRVKEQRREKRTQRNTQRKQKEPTFTLDWLYPRDLPACLELDYEVYDRRMIASLDVYEKWLEKNSHIAMCAYDRKDRRTMLAYIAMLPLPESTILEVLQGRRDETELTADDIEDYSRPGEYTLLANSVVTRPDRPDLLYQIIGRIMQCWIERYPERYISRIYAQAASAKGDILIQKFYFAPLYLLSSSGQASIVKDAYVLDLTRPGATKVIRSFQEALEKKREALALPEIEPSPLPALAALQHARIAEHAPASYAPSQSDQAVSRPRRTQREPLQLQPPPELPEGTMHLSDFVKVHGIERRRAAGYLEAPRNGLEHIAIPKPGHPKGEHDRYLTPEQHMAFVAWLRATHKPFTPCPICLAYEKGPSQ